MTARLPRRAGRRPDPPAPWPPSFLLQSGHGHPFSFFRSGLGPPPPSRPPLPLLAHHLAHCSRSHRTSHLPCRYPRCVPLSSLGRVGQRAGPGSSPLGREGGHQPDFYGGGRAGPPASEPYARGGPAHETFRPEPPSVDGKYGSDWLDGSDSPWDEGPIERSAAPMRAAPVPTPVTRVGPIDRSPWPRTLLERDAGPCPRCFSPTVVRASGRAGGGSLLSSLPGQLRDHGGVQSCPRCTWVGGAVGPPCPSDATTGAPAPVKRPLPSQPAARAAPKLRRGQDVAEETLARAERLGLTGPLGSPEDYAVTGVAPPERNSLAASLETSLRMPVRV